MTDAELTAAAKPVSIRCAEAVTADKSDVARHVGIPDEFPSAARKR